MGDGLWHVHAAHVSHVVSVLGLGARSGDNRANCSWLNQNSLKSMLLQTRSLNHMPAELGIPFMGPDPSVSPII